MVIELFIDIVFAVGTTVFDMFDFSAFSTSLDISAGFLSLFEYVAFFIPVQNLMPLIVLSLTIFQLRLALAFVKFVPHILFG